MRFCLNCDEQIMDIKREGDFCSDQCETEFREGADQELIKTLSEEKPTSIFENILKTQNEEKDAGK